MKLDMLIDILADTELLGNIPKEELAFMLGSSAYIIKEYQKEQVIHLQNEICRAVDVILDGEICVQKIDENGSVLTIGVFSAGDIIGANLIFASNNEYPMTISARSASAVLKLDKDIIIALCRQNDEFLSRFLTAVSDRTLVLAGKIDKISLKTIRQRIIDFLQYERQVQQTNVIKLNMYKKDLAERLGIPRSSLGRELGKMKRDGMIEYDAKTITIKKIDKMNTDT